MKFYNILYEAANIPFVGKQSKKHLSIQGCLKPLSIGSITNIIKQPSIVIKRKIDYQIRRLQDTIKELQFQLANPKYETVKQKNQIDIQILRDAYRIHTSYFTRVLYLKGKGNLGNIIAYERLENVYKKQLFMLQQKRLAIKTNTSQITQQQNTEQAQSENSTPNPQ